MKVFIYCVLMVMSMADVSVGDTCDIVPISQWGGEASSRVSKLPHPVDLVVVQHTASADCLTDEQCESTLRGIRYYHKHELGYDDIAQSFLIGGNGKVYEGAGWSRVGAHTRNYNNRSVAISFVGNFMNKLPSSKALQAALDLITFGVKNDYLSADYHVVGHRQVSRTLSPGDVLQKEVEVWPHWIQNIN
ncbi:peptidoglycan recognition protein-like isoform X2 [Plodia interpunctella]|uniref:peptidoglycan recognition protein-like isoform X2 n=1 Tax=Plodia interpunctella TaxID=58824 RepID=UPI0023686043|nr:peptidoglycan recognition protein-like isoform X2 [Plodia interpunctella]